MARLKFSAYSQAARVSNLDIDMDLDMGVRAVIAAKGRFAEIDQVDDSGIKITAPARFAKTAFTDTLIMPYTVTPSENVYYTANISMPSNLDVDYKPLIGSIRIGPTSIPITPRLYFDVSGLDTTRTLQVRIHKNDVVIFTTDVLTANGTIEIDLPNLIGGDVLSFSARTNKWISSVTIGNFRLAGDVIKHVIDGPSAETVYD